MANQSYYADARAPTIPPDIVRAVLRARRNDIHVGYQHAQKLAIYEAELDLVLKSNLLQA